MRLIIQIISLVLIASSVQAIFIQVGSKNICYDVKLFEQEQCSIQFDVAGKDEDNFEASIRDLKTNEIIGSVKNERIGYMSVNAKENDTQDLQLCFRAPDGILKYVSFEVQKSHHSLSGQEYVSQDNIVQTEQYFRQALEQLQALYTNFRHVSIKERSHRDIMKSTEQKINICSIIKMVVVLIVFTLQIVIVTRQFKEEKEQTPSGPSFQMI